MGKCKREECRVRNEKTQKIQEKSAAKRKEAAAF